MDGFSEKSLLSLGDYYVYGLIDHAQSKSSILEKARKTECLSMKKKAWVVQIVRS